MHVPLCAMGGWGWSLTLSTTIFPSLENQARVSVMELEVQNGSLSQLSAILNVSRAVLRAD